MTALSALALVIGLYLYRQFEQRPLHRFVVFLLAFAASAWIAVYLLSDRFSGNGVDGVVIYHLRYGLAGAGFSEFMGLIVTVSAATVLFTIFLIWYCFRKWPTKNTRWSASFSYVFLLASLLINPGTMDIYQLQAVEGDDREFYQYYEIGELKPISETHKNLVFIYVEGLEYSYFDEALFPGLITHLRDLEAKSTSFTNVRSGHQSHWTIAGIVASQLGIPLITTAGGNSMTGVDEFLPIAVGLGDLLSNEGYDLSFRGGAPLSFAGKGNFLTTHGFDDIAGREALVPLLDDPDYQSGWGLYDDSLFEFVYAKYAEMSAKDEPFGLFALTVDTHHPDGHPSRSCDGIVYADSENSILNVIACADKLVADFVNEIAASPWGENTVIVIASDHIALPNTASYILDQGERRNLLMVYEPGTGEPAQIDTMGSSYDTGSTILNFLGYSSSIGLGRSLLDSSEQAQSERQYIYENVEGWSSAVADLWGFPRLRDRLTIDTFEKTLQIDERNFELPAFVLFDDALNSVVRFDSYSGEGVIRFVEEVKEDKRFLLVDLCSRTWQLNVLMGEGHQFCVVAGNSTDYSFMGVLEDSVSFTVDEVERMLESRQIVGRNILFEDELKLAAYSISAETVNEVKITMQWDTLVQPTADHTLFIHMLNEQGDLVVQVDVPMGSGGTPTSSWQQGTTLYEAYTLSPSSELPDGIYTFRVGMYDWPSLEHLEVGENRDQFYSFGELRIENGDVEAR